MPFVLSRLPAIALCAALFCPLPAAAEDTASLDQVLATVDGTEITLGHLLALRAGLPEQYAQVPAETLFDGILNQLVQQALLAQSKDGGPSHHATFLIENETRAIIASEVTRDQMKDAVSEEAIQAAYDAQFVQADLATEYYAAHILVETKEEAEGLIQQLEGGAEFAALAREHSTGPSGPNGGDLGWFGAGVMVEPFFDAVASLSPGGVSAPVETQFGWHVITLKETRSQERPTLDEVRGQLEQELQSEAYDALIARLEKSANVERTEISQIDPSIVNQTDLLEK